MYIYIVYLSVSVSSLALIDYILARALSADGFVARFSRDSIAFRHVVNRRTIRDNLRLVNTEHTYENV